MKLKTWVLAVPVLISAGAALAQYPIMDKVADRVVQKYQNAGGSSAHAYGGGSEHTNAYGGSTSGEYGQGATHTNVYGGTTSGAYGNGATRTYATGGSVYHPPGSVAYRGYPAYHPPIAVPYYAASGCCGCAAAAGAVGGVAAGAGAGAGAAMASANAAVPASNAYRADAAASLPSLGITYAMGGNYAKIPSGCATPSVQGQTYYLCGNTWFQPAYGANGLYYKVVATP